MDVIKDVLKQYSNKPVRLLGDLMGIAALILIFWLVLLLGHAGGLQ